MTAGRKTKDGAKDIKRYQVMLDDTTHRIMLVRGNGNVSLGIRRSSKCCNTVFHVATETKGTK